MPGPCSTRHKSTSYVPALDGADALTSACARDSRQKRPGRPLYIGVLRPIVPARAVPNGQADQHHGGDECCGRRQRLVMLIPQLAQR